MNTQTPNFEEVLERALSLSAIEKVRLMEKVVMTLEREIQDQNKDPLPSLYGLCADLGNAPSAEEIDEVRREVWRNFPREDIS